jgi:ABC-type Fe3+/spermidine/putrescine transport system ATPase subunit
MAELQIENLSKYYGGSLAVDNLNLKVESGELITLLGPSGCGKTTSLRLIGGFLRPNQGNIRIAGKVANNIPPYKRDIGMVFQNYALFPHLTVEQNVEFGLKMRKLPAPERHQRVIEILKMVGLDHLAGRRPSQLSGGQQQRVALARALVINPAVLLLDEPLSNLDARLRVQLREDIKRLQREFRVTTILVTHDQDEALSMSDRIVVMNNGRVEQIATPRELYDYPATEFVARFMGEPNIWPGTLLPGQNQIRLDSLGLTIPWPVKAGKAEGPARAGEERAALLLVRSERLQLNRPRVAPSGGPRPDDSGTTEHPAGQGGLTAIAEPKIQSPVSNKVICLEGTVESYSFIGSSTRYRVKLAAGQPILADCPNANEQNYEVGETVQVSWATGDMRLIEKKGA